MEITQILQQNIYYILFGFLVLFALKNSILAKIYKLESITVQEAFEIFNKKTAKALFLDVRTSHELDFEPKIKNSKDIPLSELSKRMDEIKKKEGTNKQIILVCRSGFRAKSAGIKLKRAGFSDVYVMRGGIVGWQRADYPLIKPKRKRKNTRIG